jgi:hypothetical protein
VLYPEAVAVGSFNVMICTLQAAFCCVFLSRKQHVLLETKGIFLNSAAVELSDMVLHGL